MKKQSSYFGGIFWGVKTLCVGLKTTMRELFTKKVTEQYPENRDTLKMFDRFRGSLTRHTSSRFKALMDRHPYVGVQTQSCKQLGTPPAFPDREGQRRTGIRHIGSQFSGKTEPDIVLR